MNKTELLQELSTKIETGEISREEVESRLDVSLVAQATKDESTNKFSQFSVTKMLYVLGAAIVVIGIVIFVAQIWDDVGSFGRISVTLGLGFIFALMGSLLLKQKPKYAIGAIFHCIGGVLIPGGAVVTLSELNVNTDSMWPIAITFGIICGFYVLLHFIHKHAVLTFFALVNGTTFIYFLVGAIMESSYYIYEDMYAYVTMTVGVSYLLFAHTFRDGWNNKLIGALSLFGSAGFLGAAFSQVFDSVPWQMGYFVLVMSGLFLSVYMKSRTILVVSTLFLIAHVSYITSEYFVDSLGWPIALVILGFVFIGLGYVSITINKKYIKG